MSIRRIVNKAHREIYRVLHPQIWKKRLQINGNPTITDISNLEIGKDVSINDDVFIQCGGG